MPTYEYECKSCGHAFDIFQRMSDEPLKICPQCGRDLRRIINGGTGVIFKGSGFYVTDKKGSSAPAKDSQKAGPPEKNATSADTAASCTSCAKAESCPGNSSGGAPENKAAG
jgi:putative FmdB family regulatory protein